MVKTKRIPDGFELNVDAGSPAILGDFLDEGPASPPPVRAAVAAPVRERTRVESVPVGRQLGTNREQPNTMLSRKMLFQLSGEFVAQGVHEEISDLLASFERGADFAVEYLRIAQQAGAVGGPTFGGDVAQEFGL